MAISQHVIPSSVLTTGDLIVSPESVWNIFVVFTYIVIHNDSDRKWSGRVSILDIRNRKPPGGGGGLLTIWE